MNAERLKAKVIPALPGYNAVFIDCGEIYCEEPIIAWAIAPCIDAAGEITGDQSVAPIVVYGDCPIGCAVRLPDGRIKLGYDSIPQAEEDAIKEWREREERKVA
jgi:hypothetical protein